MKVRDDERERDGERARGAGEEKREYGRIQRIRDRKRKVNGSGNFRPEAVTFRG